MKFHFIKGRGLFVESPDGQGELGKPISEFEPKVKCEMCTRNMKTGEQSESYVVEVYDIDGNPTKEISVKCFEDISYFRDFGQPDVLLNKDAKRLLAYKLQQEAVKADIRTEFLYPQGICRTMDGTPVFVLGHLIIGKGAKQEASVMFQGEYHLKEPCPEPLFGNAWCEYAMKFINFLPGVTEVIFYASLLAIVKPFLAELGYSPDFAVSVIGKSGSMKTSLVRKYALWLDHTELQESNFQSSSRMTKILNCVDELDGLNFLMDDLHDVYGTQEKNKQRSWLDELIRHICSQKKCANVFITGENLTDKCIFSELDRMFRVFMPQMDSEQLRELKQKINSLADSFMARLAVEFTHRLMSDYENTLNDIRDYFAGYEDFGFEDASLRISRHMEILRLVEYLYRKYMCGSNERFSCRKQFEEALCKNAMRHQKDLLQQRKDEDVNYIKAVYECLTAGDKYVKIISNAAKYICSAGTCLWEGDYICIMPDTLKHGLINYLGRPVNMKKVSEALNDAGVLDRDLDARTKKIKGHRHYVIPYELLEKLYKDMDAIL